MIGLVFTGDSVVAIGEGRKNQTRRTHKHPRFKVGDCSYVKETIRCLSLQTGNPLHDDGDVATAVYAADGEQVLLDRWPWKRPELNAMFMPWALRRYDLVITEVREQRLLEMSNFDAWDEGLESWGPLLAAADVCRAAKVAGCSFEDARASYFAAWAGMHGWKSLEENPALVAYTFAAELRPELR